MLTQKEDSHLLFQRISYWLRELSFDMEGYVKNYSGFIAREFSNLALYRDDIIEKIIQRASPDDLNIVFKTSPQEILNRLFIPKETEDHLKEDFSPERVKHARLSLLNLGRELLCLPVFNYPAKEIKYSRSDEVIIFLKALPYEVSIPLISIMDLNISSSALKRYYTYHLYNREEEVLKKFFNNYYIKETEDVMSSITAEEKMIENFYPFILQIGVGLLWLVPMLTNSIEVIRKYFFQTKGIIIPDLVISVIPQIHPQYYIINMGGDRVGEGRIIGNKILALGFEKNIRLLEVENCFDPVYSGFIAWIDPHEKEKAYKYGCVVLSPEDIIPDHIIRIMERNLSLVIDANYLKAFFDIIKNSYPLLIKRFNEMNIPGEMTISILRNLVQEGVNIRDMVTILSEILYYRPRTDDVLILTEYVLKAISPLSSYNYVKHPGKKLYSFTLPHEVEEELKTLTQWDELFPEKIPEEKRKSLIDYIENLYILMKANNKKPLMVIDGEIRPYIRQLLSNDFLDLIVLSRDELDKDIELVEEVKPSAVYEFDRDILDLLSEDNLKETDRERIFWAIRTSNSGGNRAVIIVPSYYKSLLRTLTKNNPFIKVLSEEGLYYRPEIKNRINLTCFNSFIHVCSSLYREEVIEDFKIAGWEEILYALIYKNKNEYKLFSEKFCLALKLNPYLKNIFPVRELLLYILPDRSEESLTFEEAFQNTLYRKVKEISFQKNDINRILQGKFFPLEIHLSQKLYNQLAGDNLVILEKYMEDLKREFTAKTGLFLSLIEFMENSALEGYTYSILLKGFEIKRNNVYEYFPSFIDNLLQDLKRIIYKKISLFLDIKQTEEIVGRSRVKFPEKVAEIDRLRIPPDKLWKIFQSLLQKGGSLLNTGVILSIITETWQKNLEDSEIAKNILEALQIIDKQERSRAELYFIWRKKLMHHSDMITELNEPHRIYENIASIIKDFDMKSFLEKSEDYLDVAFSELLYFNKEAWMSALDFVEINDLIKSFNGISSEHKEKIWKLLPENITSLFNDISSQDTFTGDARVNLLNIFKSLVILGKCSFPQELLNSPVWLSVDRLHLRSERERLIKNLTEPQKIGIIINNLPRHISIFLKLLYPSYPLPAFHYEIAGEILKEFYKKYLTSYQQIEEDLFREIGSKICREDFSGAINTLQGMLKVCRESGKLNFLMGILLKYNGNISLSKEYIDRVIKLDSSFKELIRENDNIPESLSVTEEGFYLSCTEFYRKYGESYLAAWGYRLKSERKPDSLSFYQQGECFLDADMYEKAFLSYGKCLEWLKREDRYKPSEFMKNLLKKIFYTLFLSYTPLEIGSTVFSLPEEKIWPYLNSFCKEDNLNLIRTVSIPLEADSVNPLIKEILCLCIEEIFPEFLLKKA